MGTIGHEAPDVLAETAAEVKEGLRGGRVFETSEYGRVERVEGDGEVKEAKAAEAGVWVNLPGFVTLERVGKEQIVRDDGKEGKKKEQGRRLAARDRKKYCWETYHGVDVSNHLVWRNLTVLLQERPRGGDVFLDIFIVPGDRVARVFLVFHVTVVESCHDSYWEPNLLS